jgi:hypothetical protein
MPLDANEDAPSLSELSTCEQRFVTRFYDCHLLFTARSLQAMRHFVGTCDLLGQSCRYHLLVSGHCGYQKNISRLFYSYIYCPVLCVTCTADSREALCLLASGFKPRFVKPATIIPAVQFCIQFFHRSFECISPKLL